MSSIMNLEYTVVIRTLGTAGKKYQRLLDSLSSQTILPHDVIVYIAEEQPLPKETVGNERYVYVKKGMVAQRALPYKEVKTEWMLFLDDDVYLPPTAVETLYKELKDYEGDVISPCVFLNHCTPLRSKLRFSLLGREVCRLFGQQWAYKVLRTAGFSYNNYPSKPVYESQSNAGPCFFCRKDDFLKIKYEEEAWLDEAYYAFPDDQVMFYKMYCCGLKVLTSFDTGIIHLDASTTVTDAVEKTRKIIYSEYRNKLIFWHRFIYKPERGWFLKLWAVIAIAYAYGLQGLKYLMLYLVGNKQFALAYQKGISDAVRYLKSDEYKQLELVEK